MHEQQQRILDTRLFDQPSSSLETPRTKAFLDTVLWDLGFDIRVQ